MTKKRKTKQLRWLVTGLMLAMTMVMPASTWAQVKVMYTEYDTETKTLTFKYGVKSGSEVYDVPTDPTDPTVPGWTAYNESIKTVVFDESFYEARPTSCYKWFYGCSNLTSIYNIKNLNTEEVTNMSYMFNCCSSLTSLDLSSFNTAKVTDMMNMFGGCSGLKSLDLSSFNTAMVENMSGMFEACTNLENLNLSSFNTAKVTNMSCMFNECFALTSLNLSSFNTAKVENMSYMFCWCSCLTSLDLSSFNTANVIDMNNMFGACSDLENLDLSSFNTAKVTDMSCMFNSCSRLTTIYVSDGFTTSAGTSGSGMFTSCDKLKGAVSYDSGKTGIDMAKLDGGYFTKSNLTPYVKWNADTKVLTFKVANKKEEGSGVYDLNKGAGDPGWLENNNCEKVIFTSSFKQVWPTSCYQWFLGFSQLTTIQGIENLNTEKVTDMRYMFNNCRELTSLDLSSFNTANVMYMSNMFNNCQKLTSLDLSSFNTANVTYMSYMFSGCSGLSSLDLSSFKTAKVTHMNCMFNGCSGLTSLDLLSFNTDEVTDMSYMFSGCSGLTSLDLSSFNTAKVTKMDYMFNSCSGLTKIYVSDGFTTDHNPSGSYMFDNCTSLNGKASYSKDNTGIEMAKLGGYFTKSNLTPYVKWDANTKVLTFKVAHTKEAGSGVYDLNEGAGAPEWLENNNCEKVIFTSSFKQFWPTSCYSWFESFSNLTTIQGIENLNTEKVTNMMFMFYDCKKLTSLDLSSFKTAEVEEMSYMFGNCTGLKSLDLSLFNTVKVTHMDFMFGGCTGLKSLDLSSFNTDQVTEMIYMFYDCSGLTSLDLSSFNTAEVTNMSNMFFGCSGLTSLDLSKFNTANVEDMSNMFNGCSGLTKIYVSDAFTTNKVSESNDMFSSCSNLKGAASYSEDKIDKSMANYDGYFTPKNITPYVKWDASTNVLTFKVANNKENGSGVYDLNEGANLPGWVGEVYSDCEKVVFTPSFKQAKPTSCCQWFLGFSQLTTIEGIENLNTEEVTDMSEMFNSCSGLKSLDLSKFNTANVTNMEGMFGGCDNLISLDLSSFNTANVKDMTYMFYNCQDLTTIYVSDDFTIGNVSSSDGMFQSCFGLKGATSYDPLYTGIEMANYKDGYFKTYFTLGENKVELCGNPLTTESLNLTGDYDFTPKYAFKAEMAKYSRDLSSSESKWFSLCLPFAYTPGNNFTAYQLKGASADAVEIEKITGEIVAGTPVLFKFKDGEIKEINISATGANIVKAPVDGTKVTGTDGSSLQLCGTYQTKTFTSEDRNAFILLNNKLMNPARMLDTQNVKKVSVKPFRAYMTLTASTESSAQTSSARAFSIGHGGEGNEGTTAIDLLNSVATDDAEYYDINGRRIDAPAKGVNIVRRGNKTMKLIIK